MTAAEKQSTTFRTNVPEVIEPLAEPADLHLLANTDYIPQLDSDLKWGNNFSSVNGLSLEKKATGCCPGSLLDALTAKYMFVQGKIQQITTGKDVQFKFFRLDPQIFAAVDLNVETHDQILSTAEITDALQQVKQLCPNVSQCNNLQQLTA